MSELLLLFPELPLLVVVFLAALVFRTVRFFIGLVIVAVVVAVLLGVTVRSIADLVVGQLPATSVQGSEPRG